MSRIAGSLQTVHAAFQLAPGAEADQITDSREALQRLFDFACSIKRRMQHLTSEACLGGKAILLGRMSEAGLESLRDLMDTVAVKYPLPLISPFEGCDDIAGNMWRAREFLSEQREDAILKIVWSPNAVDLPAHAHRYSDRVILVHEGRGVFHYSYDPFESFEPSGLQQVQLKAGDILSFPKDLVHSFSTGDGNLELLSYHDPFYELDDPDQYTIPMQVWCPRMALTADVV